MAVMPEEIKACLQGAIPANLVTCSLDGEPNTAIISQVYWVDPEHVALSHQFFNKTYRNIRENPSAAVHVWDPSSGYSWTLDIQYDHSETEGGLFDRMDMQLEAIASMMGLSDIFKLKAADVYKVTAFSKNLQCRIQPVQASR